MKITFDLYSSNGYVSRNTLDEKAFEEFRKIAESLKQSVRVWSVKE
jgi:hypothetical protein